MPRRRKPTRDYAINIKLTKDEWAPLLDQTPVNLTHSEYARELMLTALEGPKRTPLEETLQVLIRQQQAVVSEFWQWRLFLLNFLPGIVPEDQRRELDSRIREFVRQSDARKADAVKPLFEGMPTL